MKTTYRLIPPDKIFNDYLVAISRGQQPKEFYHFTTEQEAINFILIKKLES